MSLESPATYGEAYFATWMEARKGQDEADGEDFKQYIPNLFNIPGLADAMPGDFLQKWTALIANPSPGLGAVGGRFLSEVADNIVGKLLDRSLQKFNHVTAAWFDDATMPSSIAMRLARRKRISPEFLAERFSHEAVGPEEANVWYADSAQPIPVLDWIRWAKYHGGLDNLWGTLQEHIDLDPMDFPIWAWQGESQFTLGQITALYNRGIMTDEFRDKELESLGWIKSKHDLIKELSWTIPNAMILMQGDLMMDRSDDIIMSDLGHADIHPDYREKYFDAVRTKPASQDLVAYHLRQDDNLVNLDADLRRIGIHPKYFEMYHALAFPLPPVADMITMAVREAFSPEVATRFGQYEDFPEPFEDFARQKGMSQDWSKRYWAAHWNLPSPQQGFAMLHRGVIDENDLHMLLRAQDVMPFWRDKLVQIAYRPLTRVDVRRMYKEGVLDETEVLSSYLDQGYAQENAERMTEFTIKQTLSSMAKFSSTDILRAFTNGVIRRGEAASLLGKIGVKSGDVNTIIEYAEYKRDWDLTQDRIGAIGNLYRKRVYDQNQAENELGRLNLPSEQSRVLLDRWYSVVREKAPVTWTKAETLKFITAGTITRNRGIMELERIGYDAEHIDAYLTLVE